MSKGIELILAASMSHTFHPVSDHTYVPKDRTKLSVYHDET